MKTLTISTVAALSFATAASAAPIGDTGFSAGAEADAHYDLTISDWNTTITPYVGYTIGGIDLTAETEIDMQELTGSAFQGLQLTAEVPFAPNTTGYVEYDTDDNFSRTKATVGFRFKF